MQMACEDMLKKDGQSRVQMQQEASDERKLIRKGACAMRPL